jgi:hypothetical protein
VGTAKWFIPLFGGVPCLQGGVVFEEEQKSYFVQILKSKKASMNSPKPKTDWAAPNPFTKIYTIILNI